MRWRRRRTACRRSSAVGTAHPGQAWLLRATGSFALTRVGSCQHDHKFRGIDTRQMAGHRICRARCPASRRRSGRRAVRPGCRVWPTPALDVAHCIPASRVNETISQIEYINQIDFDGKHHNNQMESFNGNTIGHREKVVRDLKKEDSPIIAGLQIYHNHCTTAPVPAEWPYPRRGRRNPHRREWQDTPPDSGRRPV